MPITVYGYRKPTLELELVEGGSLLADTKYYVTGFMRFTPQTYNCVSSPFSDVVEITTSSTHRSIKITQKTYRNITNFSDIGTGVTICESERHCLTTGDVIKIDSGSYAGNWTVNKIDYHTFSIETAYIDNVPVTCYTDGYRYNLPSYYYGMRDVGMLYWVHTTPPFDANDDWVFTTRAHFTESNYQYVYSIQNPVTITAPLTKAAASGSAYENLEIRKYNKGIYQTLAKEYGLVFVQVDDEAVTLQSIHNAIQDSGFIYNSYYANISTSISGEQFTLFGSIFLFGTSTLSAQGAWLNLYFSELAHITDATKMVFNSCLLNMIPISFTASYAFTANNCVLFNKGSNNNYGGWVYGDNTIFYSYPRPGYLTGSCDVPNLTHNNLYNGTTRSYGIIQNKKYYVDPTSGSFIQNSYSSNQLMNCEVPPLYWIGLYSVGCIPDIYMCENVTIFNTTYDWHYRFYNQEPAASQSNHFKYLNVNVSEDDNNIKKCIHNYVIGASGYCYASFYRRLKLYIENQAGEVIEGASVTVTDSSLNTYSGITDSSGYLQLDCLEQETKFDGPAASTASWVPTYDIYYNDFNICVNKEGYDNYSITLKQLYQPNNYDTNMNISLNISNNEINNVF